jgi:hypothetical protein
MWPLFGWTFSFNIFLGHSSSLVDGAILAVFWNGGNYCKLLTQLRLLIILVIHSLRWLLVILTLELKLQILLEILLLVQSLLSLLVALPADAMGVH